MATAFLQVPLFTLLDVVLVYALRSRARCGMTAWRRRTA